MFGGDCSHQDQIQTQKQGFCTRQLEFSSGITFSRESGMPKFGPTQAICVRFLPLIKAHVQELMSSLLVLHLNQKEKQFLN